MDNSSYLGATAYGQAHVGGPGAVAAAPSSSSSASSSSSSSAAGGGWNGAAGGTNGSNTAAAGSSSSSSMAVAPMSSTASSSTPRVLYWGSGSPPAWRALIALHEKGLTYRSEMITFESGVLKTAPMLNLNPRGLVPIFIDGEVRMYESVAILHYLEDIYPSPPLLPTERVPRSRALMRIEEANNVSAAAGEVVYYVRRTPPGEINEEYLAAKKAALHTELAIWEMYLVGTDFLAGPGYGPTLADISFFPSLAYMVRLGLRLEGRYPNLLAFFQAMCSRPSVISTWPPHWKSTAGLPILA